MYEQNILQAGHAALRDIKPDIKPQPQNLFLGPQLYQV